MRFDNFFYKKIRQHRCFFCEICEILKNTCFEEHLRTTPSEWGISWLTFCFNTDQDPKREDSGRTRQWIPYWWSKAYICRYRISVIHVDFIFWFAKILLFAKILFWSFVSALSRDCFIPRGHVNATFTLNLLL